MLSTRNLCHLLLVFVAVSCGEDPPTPVQSASSLMVSTKPWTLSAATADGVDKTALYTNLSLTFTATGFTSTNGQPVWPLSGTWKFDDTNAKTFTRDDGVQVTVTELTDKSLTMELTWATATIGPGRTASVKGRHAFKMRRS